MTSNMCLKGLTTYFVVIFFISQAFALFSTTTNVNVSTVGIGSFFHLSDWHVDPFYSPLFDSSTFCRNKTAFREYLIENAFWNQNRSEDGGKIAKDPLQWGTQAEVTTNFKFGQYGCDSPLALGEAATSAMLKISPPPDFIIYTGDMSAHDLPTWNTRTESINITTQLLRKSFPNTLIFPSLGNNDCYPDNFLRLEPQWEKKKWLENVWSMWNGYLDIPNEEYDHFVRGGFYSVKVNDKLTIISLNTIYLYSGHDPDINTTAVPDPAGQFKWMESILSDAVSNDYLVYFIGHVAPGNAWKNDYEKTYQSIISKYSSVIAGQFYGHTHKDQFSVVFDDPYSPNVVLSSYFIAPSLTPKGKNNPTFRLVSYNRNDSSLLDYYQYYADLVAATRNGVIDFRLGYQFTKLYAQLAAGSDDVNNAVNLIISNPVYYNIWLMNKNAQYSDPDDKQDDICNMIYLNHNSLHTCQNHNIYYNYY